MSAVEPATSEAVAFESAGYRCLASPGAADAVRAHVLPDPLACAQAGRHLRTAVSRLTSRVEVNGLGAVLLKVHRTRSLGERLLSLVRRGRARSEWEAARYLAARQFPVPEALAMGEQRRAGVLGASFYAARFLEGARSLEDAAPALTPSERATLVGRLAPLLRRMHDLGFDHRDLHAGNVLVAPGDAEDCELVVTDLHRSRSGAAVSDRSRRRALAQWLHSLRAWLGHEGRAAWLVAYLGAGDTPRSGDATAWSEEIEQRIARFERVRRGSRGKRCFKESTVYTRDVGGGWGARRRDLGLEELEKALAAHAGARSPDAAGHVKHSRKGVVTRHGGIVVKERRAASFVGRLRDAVLPRRHAAGYRNAHMLGVLEVGTALPLAHVRRGGSSYTLYEDLGALPRLDHHARELYTSGTRAAQAQLRDASAEWLGALHREGIYHGDLKGVNVLVGERNGAPAFRLIDTDHCRFFPHVVDARRRVKNLAQLAASIAVCVTRTERLRWYRRYVETAGVPAAERETAVQVAAALARKIVVVDEPIE
ncbi:MAG: lipopolysaccharide kinase InaA family protein [Planctomycetota bacterium]|nr:lipopolysaccharide kinase InaA family protein [Planctomycetota bacterium]